MAEKNSVPLGQLVVTRGVHERMLEDSLFNRFVLTSIGRYAHADWGDSCKEDMEHNDISLKEGERILAVYKRPKHNADTIWIITEWDRSVTTILFPEDY